MWYLISGFTTGGFDRPPALSQDVDFVSLLSTIVNYFLGFIGTFAFIIFLWAGFSILTSAGNADKVKKARTAMIYAIVGILIILLAYAGVTTLVNYLETGEVTIVGSGAATAEPSTSPRAGVPVLEGRTIEVNPTILGNPGRFQGGL